MDILWRGEDMSQELELRRAKLSWLLKQHEVTFSLEDFRPPVIESLLKGGSPQKALRALLQSSEALEELRRLERLCEPKKLREFFESGIIQIRGRDHEGRLVVWCKAFRNNYFWTKPFAEPTVYSFWVMLWAMQIRDNDTQGLFFVYDETDKAITDFNLGYIRDYTIIFLNLFGQPIENSKVWYFLRSTLFTAVANLPMRILEASGTAVLPSFKSNKTEVLTMLQDPSDYPDWFMPGGKPFYPSFESLGNFMDVIECKCGFANLTLRNCHRPDPLRIAELRKQANSATGSESTRSCFTEEFPSSGSIVLEERKLTPERILLLDLIPRVSWKRDLPISEELGTIQEIDEEAFRRSRCSETEAEQ